jgi:hypothetical protein
MPTHLIAIDSYGSQRVRAPASGAMVSAYKIGYTTIGRDVLLSLYGSQALDVTPKQASYHYVSISGETSVHNGFLLFSLTDEELAKVEGYTRYHPSSHSGCWRWLGGKWHKFPTSANKEYVLALGREGPNIDPNRYRAVSPSTGTKTAASDEIRAEKSERAGQKTWWWLTGNTYPHKDMLKRWGCRWSKGRKSWYYVGDTLPDAVQKIVSTWGGASSETDFSTETLAESFDKLVDEEEGQAAAPQTQAGQHKFGLGQSVYTAHHLRVTDSLKLPADLQGQVILRYQPAKAEFSRYYAYTGEYAYSVKFVGHEQAFPVFEENLRAEPEGGRFHSDERFPLIPGMSADAIIAMAINRRLKIPQEREVLDGLSLTKFSEGQGVYYIQHQAQSSKNGTAIAYGDKGSVQMATGTQVLVNFERAGNIMMHEDELSLNAPVQLCPCEEFGTKGWYPAPKLGGWAKCNLCNPDALNHPEPKSHETQAALPEAQVEAIRIIKPNISEDDPLFSAIQSAKQASLPINAPRLLSHKLNSIGQKYVGELTGSISGNVFCYGYAVHNDILLYLNLGGPRMAVEAIRARLAKGEIVNLVPWDAPAIELSAGETDGKANTGMYSAYLNSISEAKFTSAILVHEWLTEPNYGGKSLTGIFRTSEEQAIAKLLHHVRQLVNIPVFDTWAGYLYQAGQSAGLLRKPRSDGDIDLLVLDLDASSWTRLITGGLANQAIYLPS